MAYYVSDGFLAVCCLMIIVFLDINVEKNRQGVVQAFKRIINPATGVFLLIMFFNGMGLGIFINYVAIYLQEELGASSAMIGKLFSVMGRGSLRYISTFYVNTIRL